MAQNFLGVTPARRNQPTSSGPVSPPDAVALHTFIQASQHRIVLGQFIAAGRHDDNLAQRDDFERLAIVARFFFHIHGQRILAARHRQIHIGQQLRVEQRAVQLAVRIRDVVAVAQRIKRVALAGVQLFCLHQRVDDAVAVLDEWRQAHAREFSVQKTQVERRVVDDHLRALDEVAQFMGDLVELRFVTEELGGQAVYGQRALVRLAFRVDVAVVVIAGQLAIEDFNATDLDDAVAGAGVQACGFGIENYLPAMGFL